MAAIEPFTIITPPAKLGRLRATPQASQGNVCP